MCVCVSAYIKVQTAKVLETFNICSANISRVFKLNVTNINSHVIEKFQPQHLLNSFELTISGPRIQDQSTSSCDRVQ